MCCILTNVTLREGGTVAPPSVGPTMERRACAPLRPFRNGSGLRRRLQACAPPPEPHATSLMIGSVFGQVTVVL